MSPLSCRAKIRDALVFLSHKAAGEGLEKSNSGGDD
jgi:hypothetical protein